MIVVSVYRPETADHKSDHHPDDPFDGIEILGCYFDEHLNLVMEMITRINELHPNWHITFSSEEVTLPRKTMDVIERSPYVAT